MVVGLWWLVGACMAGNALRLRRRLNALDRLDTDGVPGSGRYTLVTAPGVTVSDDVRRAAERYADERGLDLLDLVPAALPVDDALDLLRHLAPAAYRADRLGMGRGACHALLADTEALKRARTAPRQAGTALPEWAETVPVTLDPDELAELTARARLFTSGAADLVVVDVGAAGRGGVRFRRARMRAMALVIPQTLALPQTLLAATAGYGLVLAAVAVSPAHGAGLAVLYCLLPYVVFGRTALRPRDLRRVALTRLAHTPRSIWRTLRAERTPWERRLVARRERARAWYRDQISRGVGRFVGERRADCPWCHGTRLKRHVRPRDILQGKPGRFVLERCGSCGHIFQNPPVTDEGLAFYYRDIYDGLGDVLAERIFSSNTPWYLARAAMVARHTDPAAWLDVGTGKAHFCRAARTVLPHTRFDGLDMSAAVDEAVARGWVDAGYRGQFPDLAHRLAGRYDVVSMHHYLEHTRDPLAELDTVAKILPPGGHLLIEMPDPESRFGRILRGWWVPWLAPQHLHMIPLGNLRDELEARGLEVRAVERREADQGPDFVASAAAVVNRLGLDVDRPWWPRPPGRREYAGVVGTLLLAGPLMGLAIAADVVTRPLARTNSNAYRIVARKQAG
ncbi:class I SAM-dependent methyltransferase [Actinomadura flavalba]|uniref:class I SAM-dependent methyltransferase n=1 Tax=Actinomadura flavalba TaxID=1120938 RepID=UPI00037FB651|nr:class I SAM-dependent methyltransferase [Actinomadura flavalba]